jgi:hypothetical protein
MVQDLSLFLFSCELANSVHGRVILRYIRSSNADHPHGISESQKMMIDKKAPSSSLFSPIPSSETGNALQDRHELKEASRDGDVPFRPL